MCGCGFIGVMLVVVRICSAAVVMYMYMHVGLQTYIVLPHSSVYMYNVHACTIIFTVQTVTSIHVHAYCSESFISALFQFVLQRYAKRVITYIMFSFMFLLQVMNQIWEYSRRTGAGINPMGLWSWALQYGYTSYFEVTCIYMYLTMLCMCKL